MERCIKITLFCLIFCAQFSHAQAPKAPTEKEIRQAYNNNFGQKLLFFKPYDFPVEVERTHKVMIKALDPWVKLGLVNKKKTRFLAEKMMYGEPREVSVGGFEYSLNQDNMWVSDQGFFYGRPNIKSIFNTSKVSPQNEDYVCEVYLSWYAVDIPDWLKKVNLKDRKHRDLKRALESEKRPFEKYVYFIYKEQRWQVWGKKSEESLFK